MIGFVIAIRRQIAWGGTGVATTHHNRSCTVSVGGQNKQLKESTNLYATQAEDAPFRQAMGGTAPWWFAFDGNLDSVTGQMVVGDRGIVVRTYSAVLGGVQQTAPSFSLLCDKIEIGTPAGLRSLHRGDYVNMSLELLVLPR